MRRLARPLAPVLAMMLVGCAMNQAERRDVAGKVLLAPVAVAGTLVQVIWPGPDELLVDRDAGMYRDSDYGRLDSAGRWVSR